MRRQLLASCAVAALLVVDGDASAQETVWFNNFGVQFEPLFWQRSRGGDAAINQFNGDPPGPGSQVFSFSDLGGNGTRPGLALAGVYRFNDRQSIRLRGFMNGPFGEDSTLVSDPLNGGSSSAINMAYATIPGTSTPLPGNTVDTGNSEQIFATRVRTSSYVGGAELNYIHVFQFNEFIAVRAIAGVRWIQFFDRVRASAFDDESLSIGNDVSIGMRNNMVGGQFAAEAVIRIIPNLFFNGTVSGGLYNNFVHRTRSFSAFGGKGANGVLINDSLHSSQFAQGAEGRFALVWQFLPAMSVSLGYQTLWLNNVAVSQSQFASAANGNDRDNRANSDVFFHGVNLGFSLRY